MRHASLCVFGVQNRAHAGKYTEREKQREGDHQHTLCLVQYGARIFYESLRTKPAGIDKQAETYWNSDLSPLASPFWLSARYPLEKLAAV